MKREEFDDLFDKLVAIPLVDEGFTEKGKSFYRYKKNVTIAFSRCGGRLASPGCATWILGVRHPFVWTHTPEAPALRKSLSIDEFPLSFGPIRLSNGVDSKSYIPPTLGRSNYETLNYESYQTEEIFVMLEKMTKYLIEDFLPWAYNLDPKEIADQIRENGLEYWVERYWLKYYEENGY